MTLTAHSPERSERRKAAATGTETPGGSSDDERRQTAIAALLHRVSGGLNNAAMAFELGMSSSGGADTSPRVMRAGLGGVEQAARASTLLGELLKPGTSDGEPQSRLSDVIDLLRSHAAQCSIAVRIEGDLPTGDYGATTAALAVASLLDGLAALERAGAGQSLSLGIAQVRGGARLRATTVTSAPTR